MALHITRASSQYGAVADGGALASFGRTYVLMARIKTSTTGVFQFILSKYPPGTSQNNYYQLYIFSTNVVVFEMHDSLGTSSYAIGTINVCDGQIHHVAGVWNENAVYLYIDFILDGTGDMSGVNDITQTANLEIGRQNVDYGHYADLDIQDVAIINGVWNVDRIRLHALRRLFGFAEVKAYWPLDEQAGAAAYDHAGSGHDFTLYNTPTWVEGYPTPIGASPILG